MLEDGSLLVIHNVNSITGEEKGDIFSGDGTFIGRVKNSHHGLRSMIFKNGFAYAIEKNADEEQEFVRYKMAWK